MTSNQNNLHVCPNCGTSLEDFKRTGLLGCGECYFVFREEILPAIQRIQGSVTHDGKSPVGEAEKNYSLHIEQELLRESVERALREGRFKEADEMKRRLKETYSALHPEETS